MSTAPPPIPTFIAIATFVTLLLSFHPHNHFYHSLFISPSFSNNQSVSRHLYSLTRRPHIAGSHSNAVAAAYVLSVLTSYSIPSHIRSYHVSLSYPVSRSLVLSRPPAPPLEFTLQQDIYDGDPYSDVAGQIEPTFLAYAKSGTAIGQVVYANYGRVEDFEKLERIRANVSGNVVLARYGEIFRGDIVRNAYAAGAIGVLIFTDRKDYGGGGEDAKGFPNDKWMPPSGVQVGTLYDGFGDPTTPGWASTKDCERLSDIEVHTSGNLPPPIPSLPISWADGDAIIRSIEGHVADEDWQGGKGAPVYRIGPGPGIVNLTYEGKEVISKIENVIGIIEGSEEPDRFVILGNHRDAWTFGAADPNSGTACLLEVAERIWKLQKKGWKPRRTIIFCNWDAEEHGLIGSTEWVEENRKMLSAKVVAYLNVDVAVAGAGFHAAATPQLDELIMQTAKQVMDPDNSSQTIYDSWISSTNTPMLGRLGGGGSDYAAFVQHIGVPSTDFTFRGDYPVYHSMYDDFVWMSKFGDPMFQRHVAAASMWGLVALKLADDEVLPFNYVSYAQELQKSAEALKNEVSSGGITIILDPLFKSIKELREAATKMNNEKKELEGSRRWIQTRKNRQRVREVNDRLMMAERAFTDAEGLPGRPWFKHLIYAPSKQNNYGSKSFPGIYDEVQKAKNVDGGWQSVQHEIWRVSRVITQASFCLKGELT